MAFTTQTQVNTALISAQRLRYAKASFTPQTAAVWHSLWAIAGEPAAGSTPSSGLAGDVPTKATAGAFPFVNSPSYPAVVLAIGRFEGSGVAGGVPTTFALYDRLWHNSGIDATSTGAQTINSVALTRPDANGVVADAWWHVYATMGAATPTVTLTYTNSGGTGSRSATSGVLLTGLAANRTGKFALGSGDIGVKSIQTWQADASFVSGTIDLVIRRMVAIVAAESGKTSGATVMGLGLPRVYDDACLELMILPVGTGAHIVAGQFALVQG